MMPLRLSLKPFILNTLLCMPPCFAAWYFNAHYHASIVGAIAHWLLNRWIPDIICQAAVAQAEGAPGFNLSFWTTLPASYSPVSNGVLLVRVQPLSYTYGLALFVALMLASGAKWSKILLGALILLPFQSLGIALDCLAALANTLNPELLAQLGLVGWHRQLLVLGYHFSSLILPALLPVLLWVIFCHVFILGESTGLAVDQVAK